MFVTSAFGPRLAESTGVSVPAFVVRVVMPAPAPLPRRTVAFLVDQAIVAGLVVVPALVAGVRPAAVVAPGRTRTLLFLTAMAVAFAYHFPFEWLAGWTPGKRLFGLRVVGPGGSRPDLRASFVRNVLRLVDGLGYWSVAVAVIWYRGDGRRLGDVLGGTLVVEVSAD